MFYYCNYYDQLGTAGVNSELVKANIWPSLITINSYMSLKISYSFSVNDYITVYIVKDLYFL